MHFYRGFNPIARWLVVAALVVSQLQSPFAKESIPSEERELIGQLVESLPEGFFTPRTVPNKSIPVQQIYPEWEPATRVLISIPLSEVFRYSEFMAFVMDFLEATAPHAPVGVLYNWEEEMHLGRFINRLENDSRIGGLVDRIDFIESRVHGFWIRDHGPLFASSHEGDLLILDNIYRLLEPSNPRGNQTHDASQLLAKQRYEDDLTPQSVGSYLRSKLDVEATLVKTPLHLHGGDFATDGKGNVFTSEHTITENGSDWDLIDRAFERYFGAKSSHVLNPPDGNTAKHLDLFFKIVSDDVYFLSKPPSKSFLDSSHDRFLSKQIAKTLENNRNYIRRNLPDAKVVELPMPSLLVKSRAERIQILRSELLNVVSKKAKINWDAVLSSDPNSPVVDEAYNAVSREMRKDTGVEISLTNENDLGIAAQYYLGVGIDEFLDTYVNREAVYRSYTNSLIVRNVSLDTLILLPRFSPQDGESLEVYQDMEKSVEAAYLNIYPEAKLEWIDSDAITILGGSLHCMSISVPMTHRPKAPRKVSQ